ncbi:MAG TPA: hypothetical protein VGM92_10495 [Candidatus Kapabacteria bacterium]|jgi:hypothetical protein
MRHNKFLWTGIIVWAGLTFFIGWVLITPTNPITKLYRAPITRMNDRVLTGAYPVASDFQSLKAKGVTADVSLLDPKIPYEKILLNREQKNAKKFGMRFYNFPVASILGQRFGSYYDAHVHAAALTIDSLQKDAAGDRVYLHCYLGDHRMVAVRNELKLDSTRATTASISK